jgi:catechol 2,3-dioxygenase-like lactoylglutathione lyase family enzyme
LSTSHAVALRLEVVLLPVADVDRAKAFYERLEWRLDADFPIDEHYRVVQVTPPGSPASIQFGLGLTDLEPGSMQGMMLIVDDVEAARDDLVRHGVEVEVWHGRRGADTAGRVPGPDPERTTYSSFASFSDSEGNGWILQEITNRLPGRE